MSFEDIAEVEIDYDENTFTIIRNSGHMQTYDIDAEMELLVTLYTNEGEIDMYELERTD
jgi:hypothetical protein